MRTHRLVLMSVTMALVGLAFVPTRAAATVSIEPLTCARRIVSSASCAAIVLADVNGKPASTAEPSGYGPADLQSAYRIPAGGSGRLVAVVDPYHDPNAATELTTYRARFGLPACPVGTCFRQVDQRGGTRYPAYDAGWAEEIAMDIEIVSAACPACSVLLVEADSNSYSNLGLAVNRAAALGANAISNSYAGGEFPSERSYAAYYHHPGVAITVSAGNGGFDPPGATFPAVLPTVTAVGGTHLTRASNGRGWAESVWRWTGSGCSVLIAKPAWQSDSLCPTRMIDDVSAVADPVTGVAAYSVAVGGWAVFGGTSVGAPLVASMYAIGGHTSADWTYDHAVYGGTVFDVTSGSNCGIRCTAYPWYWYRGLPGYDGPSGLGTPDGIGAF